MNFYWQQSDWPVFKYNLVEIEDLLFEFVERVGRISGFLEGLTEDAQTEAVINIMVSEAIKTSEIEGEYLNREDVKSSIRKNLGLAQDQARIHDKKAEGAAELMVDVSSSYSEKLTKDKLFQWHRMIMKGSKGVQIGEWRSHDEPMQVVSGAIGKEKVHFEAPPSDRVPKEMTRFINWFNETGPGESNAIKKPAVRSAISHVYFETIHPFEDGNGRIGRALSEKALSQGVKRPILLSLSKAIESKKNEYYNALQRAQQSNEITGWIIYFVKVTLEAQIQAEKEIEFALRKTKFFDHIKSQLNERQLKVVRRMFEEGLKGFEGGMNARKYISITHTSKATATRDLQDLAKKEVFVPIGHGRSTRYRVNID